MKEYFVYILASQSRTLYIGVTSELERRIAEHKARTIDGFTRRYNVTRLVWVESLGQISDAIAREKQLKRWSRAKKCALIEATNPEWEDLAAEW